MVTIAFFAAAHANVVVEASLLRMRTAPDEGATVSHVLRINTPVTVQEEAGPWVKVAMVNRPPEHPVTGWVWGDHLSETPVDENEVCRPGGNPEQAEDRAKQCEALRPSVGGKGRVHLAVCDGPRVEYIGELTELGFEPGHRQSEANLDLGGLSALHWQRLGPRGGMGRIEGSPFVSPFLTETWNEENVSPWAPGTCDAICESTDRIILGPCSEAGTLFMTGDVSAMSRSASINSQSHPWWDTLSAEVIGGVPVRVLQNDMGVEVGTYRNMEVQWSIGHSSTVPLYQPGRYGGAPGRAPWTAGFEVFAKKYLVVPYGGQGADRGRGYSVITVEPGHHDSDDAWTLPTLRVQTLTLEGWGC